MKTARIVILCFFVFLFPSLTMGNTISSSKQIPLPKLNKLEESTLKNLQTLAKKSEPNEFIIELLKKSSDENKTSSLDTIYPYLFASKLKQLYLQDYACREFHKGEICALEVDPIILAQDTPPKQNQWKITRANQTKNGFQIEAEVFYNQSEPQKIRMTLVKEDGLWKIEDNCNSKTNVCISASIETGLKKMDWQ